MFQVKNGVVSESAFLWAAGEATDLNTTVSLGGSEKLETATAISNSGYVAGMGSFPTTSEGTIGFLLIPK